MKGKSRCHACPLFSAHKRADMLNGAGMADTMPPEGTVASASARVNAPIMVPRTSSGKIATAASVQRSREFAAWLAELPALRRDDEERDDSYEAFMKQRRVQRDAERWQIRRLRQSEAPLLAPHEHVEPQSDNGLLDSEVSDSLSAAASSPRKINGKRPTDLELQREHDYLDWVLTLTPPERDDMPPPDESWAAFMAARRKQMEATRLQQVGKRRREERWRERGLSPPAEPAVPANHRAEVEREWRELCEEQGLPIEDQTLRRQFVERRRQRRNSERESAKRLAAGPSGRKLGRPVDPSTERREGGRGGGLG